MANYTIELRHLIASGYDIGLHDYPIPSFADETWRNELNRKIVQHYAMREICDNPDKFKLFLNRTMDEIMPVKNLLYEALATKFTMETGSTMNEYYDSQRNTKDDSQSHSDSSGDGYTLNVNSTTPGKLLNVEDEIEANTYASTARKEKNRDTSQANATSGTTGNDDFKSHRSRNGLTDRPMYELFKGYAKAIRNIDMEVINALESCFMGIF